MKLNKIVISILIISIVLIQVIDLLNTKKLKRALSKTKSKCKVKNKSKSKWASAGTHWGCSNRDPPGEVLAPFNNAGPDKFGIPIDNNYWRSSDLNPLNLNNGFINNKSNFCEKTKQLDSFPGKSKSGYNYDREKAENRRRKYNDYGDESDDTPIKLGFLGRMNGPL